jgi:hypothetical protein
MYRADTFQAWIEQKNGSVVRKLAGYGRLNGTSCESDEPDVHGKSIIH